MIRSYLCHAAPDGYFTPRPSDQIVTITADTATFEAGMLTFAGQIQAFRRAYTEYMLRMLEELEQYATTTYPGANVFLEQYVEGEDDEDDWEDWDDEDGSEPVDPGPLPTPTSGGYDALPPDSDRDALYGGFWQGQDVVFEGEGESSWEGRRSDPIDGSTLTGGMLLSDLMDTIDEELERYRKEDENGK
jgi:hypothetical protein